MDSGIRPASIRSAVYETHIVMKTPTTTAIPREPRLGIGMECLDRDLWDYVPALPHLKELGVRRARLQSGWAKTEREKGVYDFAWLDKIVGDLVAIGVEPWISLSYGNPLYAAPEEGEQTYTGQKMFPLRSKVGAEAWRNYVVAIVRRYRDRVHIWEIWNEPDVSAFLTVPEGGSWAAEYARLVRFTAPIVRAEQPEARIAVCTAAGPGTGGPRAADLFAQMIGDCADIYSFHAYEAIPERISAEARSAFYAAIRRHAPKVEFWRGEAGLSSVKAGRGALMWLPGLSEATQARWMSRHLVRDLAAPDLSFTSWFHLSFFEHFSHTCTYNYGVLRTGDYSPKPSFFVLQRIRNLFDDGHCRPDASASLILHAARLNGPDGEEQPPLQQTLAAGAAVYAFRRNGFPLFAVSAIWPAYREMEPVKVDATFFDGGADAPQRTTWREPVLLDLLDGSVTPLRPFENGFRVSFDLVHHIRVVTEAAALSGSGTSDLLGGPPAGAAAASIQANHE